MAAPAFQLVDIDDTATRRLLSQRAQQLFSETLGSASSSRVVGAGDVLEVWIWEAAPALPFGDYSS